MKAFTSDTCINPADLELYYLNSRFYDAEIGRFISADTIELVLISQTTLTDKNLYAYCDNNPVSRADDSGQVWVYAALGGGIAGGIIGALSYISSHIMSGDEFSWGQFIGTTAVGAVNGAIGGVAGVSSGFLKAGLIAVSGIVSGMFTYSTLETENKAYKQAAVLSSAMVTIIGTFAGTLIDTNSLSKGATVVANYAVTICTGVPAEIINTVMQREVSCTYTTKSVSRAQKKKQLFNTYGGGGVSRYVCAAY